MSQRHHRSGDDSERDRDRDRLGGGGGSGDVSICSSFDESEQETETTSPQYDPSARSSSHDLGRGVNPSAFVRSGPTSPGHDPFSSVESPRRRNSSADPSVSKKACAYIIVLCSVHSSLANKLRPHQTSVRQ